MTERTFAIIKPDAVERGYHPDIISDMHPRFEIADMLMTTWSPALASEFYREHSDKPFFKDLVEFMSSGPLICLVLTGDNAVSRWRALIGPTDPARAAPGTLRERYGRKGWPIMYNAVHGSDSVERAEREIHWMASAISGLPRFGTSSKGIT